ncbi:type IV toxin-antitoxin system AbiEi family antitoxin [Cryobacterium sp. TMT1-66-1]|uniref:type IV toxin-antitoxin system AbiEi family antitoxin n=1 Tax=Cryobacterium sp. TMT1-66-1 TaxID=1259242 RepID=UPI00106C56B6|nr:type IV toxin-antitoxin system AbiEi family antitoxin [Cryobacterium sp. TMT1-66-1]TFD09201.1 hypothetical protein E3T29_03255 [Cryobacterium sp. TMT1-66-1]
MTNPPGRPLTLNDLPLAELYAARLDGQVFQIADSWCVIDEIDGCDTRAIAAGQLVPPRAIAEQLTAAWIYGVTPEPRRHQFCVLIGARTTTLWSARASVREIVRTPDDVRTISGVRVTTPLRTAVDLARYAVSPPTVSPSTTSELSALLARLLHYGQYPDVSAAIRLCKRGSPAHSAIAVARFTAVSAPLFALRQQGCARSTAG